MTSFPSLRDHGPIAIDCETCDPGLLDLGPGSHRGGFICGIAIATSQFNGYFPIRHETGENLDRDKVLAWLDRELNRKNQPKIGANLLYDLEMLDAEDITVTGPYYDIQLAEPLIDETKFSYSLDNLAKQYLNRGKDESKMLAWIVEHFKCKPKDAKNYIWKCPPEIVHDYAIADVVLPLKIWAKQYVKLKQLDLLRLYDTEQALLPVLLHMRRIGQRINNKKAGKLQKVFAGQQVELQSQVKRMTGLDVQPWAAASIATAFDKLDIPYPRTEKTDAPSFRADWLKQHDHPLPKLIVDIRQLDKLANTFLEGLSQSERIFTQFHQLRTDSNGTISGRFSSSGEMNLQQIPVRSKNGRMLRELFIPEIDHDYGVIDESQIEFRCMVSDAEELDLRGSHKIGDMFRAGTADFHTVVAELAGIDRDSAKTINFGLAFGEGVRKLCRALGLTQAQGYRLINKYHARIPFMKGLMKHYSRMASQTGEVRTLYNRLRHFNMWRCRNGRIVVTADPPDDAVERLYTYRALNARIQGSAADILKRAMVAIYQAGLLDVLLLHLTIHDELTFSIPRTRIGRDAFAEAKNLMEVTSPLTIPVVAVAKIGTNWGTAKG